MSVAGFGVVALGAAGGAARAGGPARVTIATATDSRTIPEGVLVAPRGRPGRAGRPSRATSAMQRLAKRD